MADRHPKGYLDSPREPIGYREASVRITDFDEIYAPHWQDDQLRNQGRRCMDCGVATCMGGCPIGNLIPEWNHLVSEGRWRDALDRLHATNNFPEFTGYTCPAPCEPACVLAVNDQPVTIKSLERAIVDMGWASGWIVPEPPRRRSRYSVGVVGSGPAGLACAQQLNRAGHRVTVYERDDVIGGLMTYGIPDFKFAKHRVAQRVRQLEAEGITFHTGAEVGRNPSLAALRAAHDAVCLAIGALAQRDPEVPGRELPGVEPAMTYLVQENRRQAGRAADRPILATGRRVVVLGGGDTGADCVATANRQGAAEVAQVDINLPRPDVRLPDNPWPEPPVTRERTYAQEEGSTDEYGFETLSFTAAPDGKRVKAVRGQRVSWTYSAHRRRLSRTVLEPDVEIAADLVLIAAGFSGPELEVFGGELAVTDRGTLRVDASMQTNIDGVFAAGDASLGQSIVVWAIGEGRDAAHAIDTYLTGASDLPPSLRTHNPPSEWRLRAPS